MSTYWHLQCLAHDPPITSDSEVEQHTYRLGVIREIVKARPTTVKDDLSYFKRNATVFMIQHPHCPVQLVSEYGETEPLPAPQQGGDTATALDSIRADAWDEGNDAGYGDAVFDESDPATASVAHEYPHQNPYRPSGEATS